MQPVTTTDADYQQADADTGAELLRLRRERIVLIRRVTELEAEQAAWTAERGELQEQLRRLAQQQPEEAGT